MTKFNIIISLRSATASGRIGDRFFTDLELGITYEQITKHYFLYIEGIRTWEFSVQIGSLNGNLRLITFKYSTSSNSRDELFPFVKV